MGEGPLFTPLTPTRLQPTQKGSDCAASRQKKMFDVRRGMMDPVKVWSSDAPLRESVCPQNCPVRELERAETGRFVWDQIMWCSLFIFLF